MGAIAVSQADEQQIAKLYREIQDSVRRCATADRAENRELFAAGACEDQLDEW